MKKRLLLISNSVTYGKGYLDHCEDEIIDFLGKIKKILFIPYALYDWGKYENIAKERFQKLGISLKSIHNFKNPRKEIFKASAVFIGGGNTFRLLNYLYKNSLIEIIRKKVNEGMLYVGVSAGSNVACPTIKTTNDMPIVQPPTIKAIDLISFQINPHYIDADPNSKHKTETREQRIKEFHEENNTVVVGLREGAWLRIENNKIHLKGLAGAKIFQKGKESIEYKPNSFLDFLV